MSLDDLGICQYTLVIYTTDLVRTDWMDGAALTASYWHPDVLAWAARVGVGVKFGDVIYGNIGSRTRLDITVIGPAVNIVSRLETLTKTAEPHVLFSAALWSARAAGRC